jgi:adenine-specific DNA-methyltransferase
VTGEGVFNFSAVRRNHQPYLHVYPGQEYLVTKKSCVLVQRTTAKEQKRRLIAALLPQEFIEKHGGVVVENHLNMIRSSEDKPRISPKVITAILNTKTLDFAFRCSGGSIHTGRTICDMYAVSLRRRGVESRQQSPSNVKISRAGLAFNKYRHQG